MYIHNHSKSYVPDLACTALSKLCHHPILKSGWLFARICLNVITNYLSYIFCFWSSTYLFFLAKPLYITGNMVRPLQRRISNPAKHLLWSLPLTIFAENSIVDARQGSRYASTLNVCNVKKSVSSSHQYIIRDLKMLLAFHNHHQTYFFSWN